MPNKGGAGRMRAEQLAEILAAYDAEERRGVPVMQRYVNVGAQVGRSPGVISSVIHRLRPTTDLARAYLRAKSFKMTMKMVREAKTPEIIDILSRPNVGVLDPIKKGEEGSGFFMSMTADSCGAVKIGITNQSPQHVEQEMYENQRAQLTEAPQSVQGPQLTEAAQRLRDRAQARTFPAITGEERVMAWGRQRGVNPREQQPRLQNVDEDTEVPEPEVTHD